MMSSITHFILLILILTIVSGCTPDPGSELNSTTKIIVTSEAGAIHRNQTNVEFKTGTASGVVVSIFPDQKKQTIDGIGSSFTESSAFVLAHLESDQRAKVMESIYGESGANFSLARTHIGACDFSVEGKYSYANTPGDKNLDGFSIAPDQEGFAQQKHPNLKDPDYDLLPMIKEALAIKEKQTDKDLRIVGSAWTAPPWMKDNEDYYTNATAETNWQGTGGSLKPQFVSTYSDYLIKYLDAYNSEGVDIWALTPVNEPHGNNGQWESMNFTPETQNEFIKHHLGPGLAQSQFPKTKILIFDQNRDGLQEWADAIYADEETAPHVHGMAVHWYESTFKVYEDAFDRIKNQYPEFAIVHTEGCIDDLGKPAPADCTDPAGRTEKDWFQNDAFWWTPSASDWAYAVPWAGPTAADHPLYTPVHRYARNIIVSLDHWVSGWIDWNIVLDQQGGPNHVGNFCGAPIMIDTQTGDIYYTPVFHILSQFSRTIRPGDMAVQTQKQLGTLGTDDLHACATINDENLLSIQLLNTSAVPIAYQLQIREQFAEITIAANAVQTVQIQIP